MKSVIFFYINLCRRENKMRLDSSFSTSGIEDSYSSFYVRLQSVGRQKTISYFITKYKTCFLSFIKQEWERKEAICFIWLNFCSLHLDLFWHQFSILTHYLGKVILLYRLCNYARVTTTPEKNSTLMCGKYYNNIILKKLKILYFNFIK